MNLTQEDQGKIMTIEERRGKEAYYAPCKKPCNEDREGPGGLAQGFLQKSILEVCEAYRCFWLSFSKEKARGVGPERRNYEGP